MTSVSPTGSTSSLVISLSDQLEWQQGARTHSPRTPSAPEILRSLRKQSPPATASRWNESLSDESAEETNMSGFEALTMLAEHVKLGVVRGESLSFPDGCSFPLDMELPLTVRIVERKDDSLDSMAIESMAPLTVGSAWLSLVAEYTYESQLASLLRARKGLSEILIDDRRVINRYLLGKLSMDGLKASSMWSGSPSEASERGLAELNAPSSDILSVRLKKKQQIQSLEEKRSMLQDQQNRLRKLLARELQRMHSVKPAATIKTTNAISNQAEVSNVVANMLKRFKPKDGTITPPTPATPFQPVGNNVLIQSSKLRGLKVEWYRVTEKLRSAIEEEEVLERKIKRLRYVVAI